MLSLFLCNQWANFNQTWNKALLYKVLKRKTRCLGLHLEMWLLYYNVNAFLVIAIFFLHESACIISNVSHGLLLKIVR